MKERMRLLLLTILMHGRLYFSTPHAVDIQIVRVIHTYVKILLFNNINGKKVFFNRSLHIGEPNENIFV